MTTKSQKTQSQPPSRGIGSMGMGQGGGGGGTGGPFGGMFNTAIQPKDFKKTIQRLLVLLKPQLGHLLTVAMLVVVAAGSALVASRMIGVAIDKYILVGDMRGLAKYVMGLLAVYLAGGLASWLQTFIMAGVSQRVIYDLRGRLFSRIQELPLSYFDQHTRGEIMSRLVNDVETLSQALASSTTLVFSSVITVVGALLAMLLLSPVMTLVSLVSVPLATAVARRIARYTRSLFRQQQQSMGQLNGLMEESVNGHKVVLVFGQEEHLLHRFRGINSRLQEAGTRAQIFSGFVRPIMTLVSNLSFGLLSITGGILVLQGRLQIGQVASFMQYNKQFSGPVNELANQFNSLQSAVAGLERVYELLDEPAEQEDTPGATELSNVTGDVQFHNVSFAYRVGEPVLKNISLHASPGSTIAIVGPTGAGKTTIVNLLMRFYEIENGRITIDGHEINMVTRDSLRSVLGIVLQDTYLFSGTVRDNIRYGRLDASDEEVEAAAKLTTADSFIQQLPQAYDTILTEEGSNLSQGQRQLLSITRAVLADPKVLILDEATSSVDTRTEMNIQKAMLNLMQGRTSFVIAHRLSTIRGADNIIVIDDGKIIEQGKHNQLLQRQGHYAKLYYSQFHREEVVRQSI